MSGTTNSICYLHNRENIAIGETTLIHARRQLCLTAIETLQSGFWLEASSMFRDVSAKPGKNADRAANYKTADASNLKPRAGKSRFPRFAQRQNTDWRLKRTERPVSFLSLSFQNCHAYMRINK
jgi:hypothetical protein